MVYNYHKVHFYHLLRLIQHCVLCTVGHLAWLYFQAVIVVATQILSPLLPGSKLGFQAHLTEISAKAQAIVHFLNFKLCGVLKEKKQSDLR